MSEPTIGDVYAGLEGFTEGRIVCGLAGTVVWPCPTPRCIANDGHRGGHVLAD